MACIYHQWATRDYPIGNGLWIRETYCVYCGYITSQVTYRE